MPSYLLDKKYKVAEPGGVMANRVVIYGAESGCVEYMNKGFDKYIAGIAIHKQAGGEYVMVRKLGIAMCETAGPVIAGENVYIADDVGRIIGEEGKAKCFWAVGIAEESADAAGEFVDVFLTL